MKGSNTFLSDRQIEILKLRRQGLTQREIAERLNTTRENISILESRAYKNINRAIATLEILDKSELSVRFAIPPETYILDVPKIILEKADKANIKVNRDCVDILENVKLHHKIVDKHVVKPLIITILPDGNLRVE